MNLLLCCVVLYCARYFYNTTYWKGANSQAPVFLCVGKFCYLVTLLLPPPMPSLAQLPLHHHPQYPFSLGGEGPPLDDTVLTDSVHCSDMVELAWQHGALLLALEHRYYGPSTPNDSLETENLRWLNTEQALGDMAHFHSVMSEKFDLTGRDLPSCITSPQDSSSASNVSPYHQLRQRTTSGLHGAVVIRACWRRWQDTATPTLSMR